MVREMEVIGAGTGPLMATESLDDVHERTLIGNSVRARWQRSLHFRSVAITVGVRTIELGRLGSASCSLGDGCALSLGGYWLAHEKSLAQAAAFANVSDGSKPEFLMENERGRVLDRGGGHGSYYSLLITEFGQHLFIQPTPNSTMTELWRDRHLCYLDSVIAGDAEQLRLVDLSEGSYDHKPADLAVVALADQRESAVRHHHRVVLSSEAVEKETACGIGGYVEAAACGDSGDGVGVAESRTPHCQTALACASTAVCA